AGGDRAHGRGSSSRTPRRARSRSAAHRSRDRHRSAYRARGGLSHTEGRCELSAAAAPHRGTRDCDCGSTRVLQRNGDDQQHADPAISERAVRARVRHARSAPVHRRAGAFGTWTPAMSAAIVILLFVVAIVPMPSSWRTPLFVVGMILIGFFGWKSSL